MTGVHSVPEHTMLMGASPVYRDYGTLSPEDVLATAGVANSDYLRSRLHLLQHVLQVVTPMLATCCA